MGRGLGFGCCVLKRVARIWRTAQVSGQGFRVLGLRDSGSGCRVQVLDGKGLRKAQGLGFWV